MKQIIKVQFEPNKKIKNKQSHIHGANVLEINTKEYLKDFYENLLLNQEPLGKEFSDILYANLDTLLIKGENG